MKMYELIEKFAANPCGDGGSEKGFHEGNTCQKGGAATSPASSKLAAAKKISSGVGKKLPDMAKIVKSKLPSGAPKKSPAESAFDSLVSKNVYDPSVYVNSNERIDHILSDLSSFMNHSSHADRVEEARFLGPINLVFVRDNIDEFAAASGFDASELSGVVGDAIAQFTYKAVSDAEEKNKAAGEKAAKKDGYDKSNEESMFLWGNNHFGEWAASIDQDELEAVGYYASEGYRQMNATMRGFVYPDGVGDPYDKIKKNIEKLNESLYKTSAPQDMEVVRGYAGVPGVIFGLDADNVTPGAIIRDPAFMSTTLKEKPPSVAQSQIGKNNTVVKISLPKGTPGAYLPAVRGRTFVPSHEQEFLIPAGAVHLRIDRYEVDPNDPNRHVIHATAVRSGSRDIDIPGPVASEGNPGEPKEKEGWGDV